MLFSGFAFRAWEVPHAQQKCIAGAKGRKIVMVSQLVDLYCDGEPKELSLDHAASLALPYLWQRARFVAE